MLVQLPQPNGSWLSAADVISVVATNQTSFKSYLLRVWVVNHTRGTGLVRPDIVEIEFASAEEASNARDKFAAEVNLALRGESNAIPKQ